MITKSTKGKLSSFLNFNRLFSTAVTNSQVGTQNNSENETKDDVIYKAADKIIEERIRPLIQADGGDVSLENVKNGILIVSLTGNCQGCASKNTTLHNGILGIIQDEVPGVKGIREQMDIDIFDN